MEIGCVYCKSESPALVSVVKAWQPSSCQSPHQNKHANRNRTWLHVSPFPSVIWNSDLSVLVFAPMILLSLWRQSHIHWELINKSFWMYRRFIFGMFIPVICSPFLAISCLCLRGFFRASFAIRIKNVGVFQSIKVDTFKFCRTCRINATLKHLRGNFHD